MHTPHSCLGRPRGQDDKKIIWCSKYIYYILVVSCEAALIQLKLVKCVETTQGEQWGEPSSGCTNWKWDYWTLSKSTCLVTLCQLGKYLSSGKYVGQWVSVVLTWSGIIWWILDKMVRNGNFVECRKFGNSLIKSLWIWSPVGWNRCILATRLYSNAHPDKLHGHITHL